MTSQTSLSVGFDRERENGVSNYDPGGSKLDTKSTGVKQIIGINLGLSRKKKDKSPKSDALY